MTPILSVLDQSFTRQADQAHQAFQDTLTAARHCEQLGYHRFWVSEHHASNIIAGSAPEILLAAIGAHTERIRIGSGGVMLPHYSAYKVAEVFSVLANLYPGRVDCGVGRAPGTDMSTARALAKDGQPDFYRFPEQVQQLCAYLWDSDATPMLRPKPPEPIPVWCLGSSPDSALLAARQGLPYNIALFINPNIDPDLIGAYRQHFQPSEHCPEPRVIVSVSVLCHDDETALQRLEHTADVNYLRFFAEGGKAEFLSPDEAASVQLSARDRAVLHSVLKGRVSGNAAQVCERLLQIAESYQAEELMLVTNTYHLQDKLDSFERAAKAMATIGR